MKKTTLQQNLFNQARGLRNWVRRHEIGVAVGLTAVGVAGLTYSVGELKKSIDVCAQRALAEEQGIYQYATDANQKLQKVQDENETNQMLRDIASQMHLTAEQIDQLCTDYDLPRAIFDNLPAPKATADQELAK